MKIYSCQSLEHIVQTKWSSLAWVTFIGVLLVTFGQIHATVATPSKLPMGMFSGSGNQIVDANNNPVRLACVYWPGMNGEDGQLSNVSAPISGVQANINAISAAGFNCIRVDFNNTSLHDSGSTAFLAELDSVVTAAAVSNLRVIIDDHDNEGNYGTNDNYTKDCAAQQANGIWYDLGGASNGTDGCGDTGHTTQASYQRDWVSIASRYANNNTVIGYDLWNEPQSYGNSTWGDGTDHDIHLMYQTVGSAMLAVDPTKLIFAECPQYYGPGTLFNGTTGNAPWGDCTGAKDFPVVFTVNGSIITNKSIYDVHLYPNSVSNAAYLFGGSDYGAAAVSAMNSTFGYLLSQNIAPVWDGEGGTGLSVNPADQDWANMLDSYLNGQLGSEGAPTFTSNQQGINFDWMAWTTPEGTSPGADNLGIINTNGTVNASQASVVDAILYYPAEPASGSLVNIVNTAGSLCVDVPNGSTSPGVQFDLYTCNATWWAQQFIAELQSDGTYLLMNKNSNLCIEISGASTAPGSIAEQDTCHSSYWSQQFTLTPSGSSYSLKNKNSGLCLASTSNSLSVGSTLEQSSCSGEASELFHFQ